MHHTGVTINVLFVYIRNKTVSYSSLNICEFFYVCMLLNQLKLWDMLKSLKNFSIHET